MKQIYDAGTYDFHYVSLVSNKCTPAAQRMSQLGISGVPDVWFDGKYTNAVGAYPTVPQQVTYYTPKITSAGNRTVPDIDTSVSVQWLGNATMQITVSVTNNETNTYRGFLRVYVCEKVSSFNWNSGGTPYSYPFLEWAWTPAQMNIPAGGTYMESTIWVGADHNSGKGQVYSTIQSDNIKIVAAVFEGVNSIDCATAEPEFSFTSDVDTLSVTGGTANLDLNAGEPQAGRTYLILGSFAGSTPGTTLPGGLATLPVNWDNITDLIINSLNGPTFVDFLNVLDGNGTGDAQVVISSLNANKIGKVLTLAYLLEGTPDWDFASNHVDIEFVP